MTKRGALVLRCEIGAIHTSVAKGSESVLGHLAAGVTGQITLDEYK